MYKCIYIYISFLLLHVLMSLSIHVYVYIYGYVCTCMYLHVHAYIYVHIQASQLKHLLSGCLLIAHVCFSLSLSLSFLSLSSSLFSVVFDGRLGTYWLAAGTLAWWPLCAVLLQFQRCVEQDKVMLHCAAWRGY